MDNIAMTQTWRPLDDTETYLAFTPPPHMIAATIRSEGRQWIESKTGVSAACRVHKCGVLKIVLRGIKVDQEMMDKATHI